MRTVKLLGVKLGSLLNLACVLSLGLTCGTAPASQHPVPGAAPDVETPRIVDHIDEGNLAVLKGNTRPEARAEFDRGPVASNLPMKDLILVLQRGPAQQAAFEAFLASQQDLASPNYHHWLTPEEIGQKFGPALADIDTVSQWLRNHGFAIDNVSRDRLFIRFDGNAAQVQSAFHTEIHNLNVHGESHIANMSDPQIPAALTPVVFGVKALHNFFPRPTHRLGSLVRRNSQGGWERISSPANSPSRQVTPAEGSKQISPLFGTGGTTSNLANVEDVAPYDLAAIYNFLPLWTAGTPINGAGQTIAIAGTSNINLADVTTFRSAFGLPAYTSANAPQVIITNSDPGDCPGFDQTCAGDLVENSLDVEWSGAAAPGAQIILVTSSATAVTTDALFASEEYIVDNVTAPIMNVSYGECELGLGASGNTSYEALWAQAQGEGIAVFVSTGDSGSASCDDGGDNGGTNVPYGAQYGLSVSGLASTPYNTAVGGTDFNWSWDNEQSKYWASSNNSTTLASALGYIPEFPWNSTCSNPLLDTSINSALKESLTAGEICDQIGRGEINSKDGSILYLVDTVGGSGGPSNCIDGDGQNLSSCTKGYPKPSWQTGVTGIPNDSVRDIPDVSLFASSGFSGSAYVICVSGAGACTYNATTEPIAQEVGGTSVASPIMAGIAALLNQKVGGAQGNLNTQLYELAAKETYSNCSAESVPLTGSSCVFNDIDTGTNAMPCDVGSPNCITGGDEVDFNVLTGYAATAGYDPATGLGSVNVANLANIFNTVTPPVTIFPTSLSFPSTPVGTTDPTPLSVTIANTGSTALKISSVDLSGPFYSDFVLTSDTCSTTTPLAVGSSCKITVSFTPSIPNTFLRGFITITDNASSSPQTIALYGGGFVPTPGATLSTGRLAFPATLVGTSATPLPVTLTSSGTAPLIISGFSLVGVNPAYFSQTNTCGTPPITLAVGASCVIDVDFTPETAGDFSANLSVDINLANLFITGTGMPPSPVVSLNPSTPLSFSTTAGTSASVQTVAITNSGNAALMLSSISITGANAGLFTQTNNCGTLPVSIAPTQGCTVILTFSPTTFGTFTASLNFTDNAANSPQTAMLNGTATEVGMYTLSAAAVTLSSAGSSGTSAITGTGSSGYSGPNTVTLNSCVLATSPSGASDVPTCTLTTPTVTFAAGSNSGAGGLVTINSTGPTAALKQAKLDKGSAFRRWAGAGGVALAGLLLLGIPARRRGWKSMLVLLVFAAAFASLSGCGGGSGGGGGGGGGGGSTGTTTGSYTFTIKGTDSDNVTSVVTLTVTVN